MTVHYGRTIIVVLVVFLLTLGGCQTASEKQEQKIIAWLEQERGRFGWRSIGTPRSYPDLDKWAEEGKGLVGLERVLPRMLRTRDDRVDLAVVAYAAGRFQVRESVPVLTEWLRDPDPAFQREGAGALGMIGDPRPVEPLCELLNETPDVNVFYAVLYALDEIGHPRAIPALEEARRTAWSASVREMVDEALKKFQPAAATRPAATTHPGGRP